MNKRTDAIGIFPIKDRKKKLKHPLTKEVLKHLVATKGLTKAGLAAEYGVTETHFRKLIQDRVSLNEGINEGLEIWNKNHPLGL
jgi:hypothetical protein